MSIKKLLEQALDQTNSLEPKKIVLAESGYFARQVPYEVFTNPDLIAAVESGNFVQTTEVLVRLSREYHQANPSFLKTYDYSRDKLNPEYRTKTQQEIDTFFQKVRPGNLIVVTVRGRFKVKANHDEIFEYAVDQVQLLEDLNELPYE